MIQPPSIENIYISNHYPERTYEKYDLLHHEGEFYVVAKDGPFTITEPPVGSNDYFKKFGDTSWKFTDVWSPSFTTDKTLQPIQFATIFGDGYSQRFDSSIFPNLLSYNLVFSQISDKELKSLLAFFEYNGGTDYFIIDIDPFIENRKFIARNPSFTYAGNNINELGVQIIEYVGFNDISRPIISYDRIEDSNVYIITITHENENATIYYKVNNNIFTKYITPFNVEGGATITAYAIYENMISAESTLSTSLVTDSVKFNAFVTPTFQVLPEVSSIQDPAQTITKLNVHYTIEDPENLIDFHSMSIEPFVTTRFGSQNFITSVVKISDTQQEITIDWSSSGGFIMDVRIEVSINYIDKNGTRGFFFKNLFSVVQQKGYTSWPDISVSPMELNVLTPIPSSDICTNINGQYIRIIGSGISGNGIWSSVVIKWVDLSGLIGQPNVTQISHDLYHGIFDIYWCSNFKDERNRSFLGYFIVEVSIPLTSIVSRRISDIISIQIKET